MADLETRSEALNFDRRERQSSQRSSRYGSPPWGDDNLRQHVDSLERQVRQVQREIQDLRSMLDNNPSGQQSARTDSNRSSFDRTNSNRSSNDRMNRSNRGDSNRNDSDRSSSNRNDRTQDERNRDQ